MDNCHLIIERLLTYHKSTALSTVATQSPSSTLSKFQSVPSCSTLYPRQIEYGRRKHSYRCRQRDLSGCRSQVRNANEFSISSDTKFRNPRNKRGHSSNSQNIPLPELWYRVYGFTQRSRCHNGKLWKQYSTSYLFVCFPLTFVLIWLGHTILFRSPSWDYWKWESSTLTTSCSHQWYVDTCAIGDYSGSILDAFFC